MNIVVQTWTQPPPTTASSWAPFSPFPSYPAAGSPVATL